MNKIKVHTDIKSFKARNPVITVGIFDGVHLGHKKILSRVVEAAKDNDSESVVFTLWPHPRLVLNSNKGELKFLTTIDEKIELLEKTGIDHVVIYPFSQEFAKLTACNFIKQILVDSLNVKKLIVGYNHKFGKDQEGNFDNLSLCAKEYGFAIEKLDAFENTEIKVSSTAIREAILNKNVMLANKLLGYQYFITGKVVGGSQVGRKIGFPTANIELYEDYKLIPANGVYAVWVHVNGAQYKGMLNIGVRPTIDGKNSRKSIEVHILDFDKNLYDKKITIRFVDRIRDEKMFENVNALTYQLKEDKKRILEILSSQSK